MSDENVCLSGGAIGADTHWGYWARKAGHLVRHFTFNGHSASIPDGEAVVLSEEQLKAADPYLVAALIKMRRERLETRSPTVKSLLRRNWWQVRDSDACYGIAEYIKSDGTLAGGTGYAVQMFIDRGLTSLEAGPWIFSQKDGWWYGWNRSWARWDKIDRPPRPEGRYAGIGTRKLNNWGRKAIEEVYHEHN